MKAGAGAAHGGNGSCRRPGGRQTGPGDHSWAPVEGTIDHRPRQGEASPLRGEPADHLRPPTALAKDELDEARAAGPLPGPPREAQERHEGTCPGGCLRGRTSVETGQAADGCALTASTRTTFTKHAAPLTSAATAHNRWVGQVARHWSLKSPQCVRDRLPHERQSLHQRRTAPLFTLSLAAGVF